jgi:hypothetical protein
MALRVAAAAVRLSRDDAEGTDALRKLKAPAFFAFRFS